MTARLLLRPWRAADAPILLPILEANQGHLGSWIPRHVSEPVPVPELAARLEARAADFAADRAWRYACFRREDERLLGEVSLFPRSAAGRVPLPEADRLEIGYWIRSDAAGHGLATEAARAMRDAALSLPQGRLVEIRCDPRNAPSGAVARRLGFTVRRPDDRDEIDTQVWTYARPVP